MKKLLIFLLLIPALSFGQMKSKVLHYGSSGSYIKYEPTTLKAEAVILWMGGTGEQGSDLSVLKKIEIPLLFEKGAEKPYIVLCPQLAADKSGWGDNEIYPMLNILDTYDLPKVVTGLSLGGMGTYAAILRAYIYNGNKPGYFVAAAPICGRTTTTNVDAFKGMAIKIYHGDKDPRVPYSPDNTLYKLLSSNQIDVQFKTYIGAGHNIWGTAYNEDPESFWAWLNGKIPAQPADSSKSNIQNKILQIETQLSELKELVN